VQVFRGFPARGPNGHVALTIGNFDGVHRGHRAMLERLIEASDDLGLPAAVLTFDPHPREFFSRDNAPPRLSSVRMKLEAFADHRVDRVYIARFNAQFAALAPDAFVEDVLVRTLGVRWVLVGDDFRFGRSRAGDLAALRADAATFSVEAMPTVCIAGERASSTAIRSALAAGDLERAALLLGRPYTVSGHVAHGDKRGRRLGFPTANIPLRRKPALSGIFAVRVHGLGSSARTGVASLGIRPTVKQDGRPLLEVYLFDFDESIYGKRIQVEFLHKLRDEERYADLDRLTRQIGVDVAQAREYFANLA
jgi:riboflavin kinase / FMN adenylyltransferase